MSRVRRLPIAVFLSTLALGLVLSQTSHAGKGPAYKAFKPGQNVKKAFRSVTRQYKPLRSLYRSNKSLHAVSKPIKDGIFNMALLPITGSSIGFAGHQCAKNVQYMSEAVARGNTVEIVGGAVMTTIVAGFAMGNVWLSKETIKSGKRRFAEARKLRGFARRDTLKALINSPDLQRQVNKGQLLPTAELKVLKSLAKALPKPSASYKPSGTPRNSTVAIL